MMLYFGARRPEELPYFGPLQKVPDGLLRKHFAYSRVPGEPKTYVQDRMRATPDEVATFLKSAKTHVYLCGLKGMEAGVDEAFADICRNAGLDWAGFARRDARAGALSRGDVLRFECPMSVTNRPLRSTSRNVRFDPHQVRPRRNTSICTVSMRSGRRSRTGSGRNRDRRNSLWHDGIRHQEIPTVI